MDDATTGELRRTGRTLTRPAGALLAVRLLATASDLAAGLGVVRALPGGEPVARVKSGWGVDLRFSPGGRWLTEAGERVFRVFDRMSYALILSVKDPVKAAKK